MINIEAWILLKIRIIFFVLLFIKEENNQIRINVLSNSSADHNLLKSPMLVEFFQLKITEPLYLTRQTELQFPTDLPLLKLSPTKFITP